MWVFMMGLREVSWAFRCHQTRRAIYHRVHLFGDHPPMVIEPKHGIWYHLIWLPEVVCFSSTATTTISYIIFHRSYIIYHISYTIYHISYIIYHISYIIYHISYIIYHISYIIYHIYIYIHIHIIRIVYPWHAPPPGGDYAAVGRGVALLRRRLVQQATEEIRQGHVELRLIAELLVDAVLNRAFRGGNSVGELWCFSQNGIIGINQLGTY